MHCPGGAVGATFTASASPAAAQMAQGHREVRPGVPPLLGVRVIERSVLLSGRLAGLLLADQGAEVFVNAPPPGATPARRLDAAFFDRGKVVVPQGAATGRRLGRHCHCGRRRTGRAGAASDRASHHGGDARRRSLWASAARLLGGSDQRGLGFFTNMSVSGLILNRPVIYTPIPLPSVYCGVNGPVATVSALVDRLRTGMGREIIASRIAGGLSAIGALSMTSKGLPEFLEPIVIGGLPPGMTPEQFHTFVADAVRDPERQMWLERRFAPFSTPYRARDNRWILPMAAPNARLSRRLLEAIGLWDKALATGAVFSNLYDPANIADRAAQHGRQSFARLYLHLGSRRPARTRLRYPNRGGVGAFPGRERHRGHRHDDLGGVAARRRCAHGRRLHRDPGDRGRAEWADELDAQRAALRATCRPAASPLPFPLAQRRHRPRRAGRMLACRSKATRSLT